MPAALPPASATDAVATLELIEAALESVRTGAVVEAETFSRG